MGEREREFSPFFFLASTTLSEFAKNRIERGDEWMGGWGWGGSVGKGKGWKREVRIGLGTLLI